jgi:hypothetical protein
MEQRKSTHQEEINFHSGHSSEPNQPIVRWGSNQSQWHSDKEQEQIDRNEKCRNYSSYAE